MPSSKVYVEVTARFAADGSLTPLSFTWDDGRRYDVDRILDRRNAASLKAGGNGLRFTVKVRGKETYMFFDTFEFRWFMERK